MTSRHPTISNHFTGRSSRTASTGGLRIFSMKTHSYLAGQRVGFLSVPRRLTISDMNMNNVAGPRKLTRLLLNVTIGRSLGPVKVIMSSEYRVKDLIKATIDIYVKEKRLPLLKEMDPDLFELHYSPFSLESLDANDKLESLGSRNFFMCPKPSRTALEKPNQKEVNPLTKLMAFLL
ncbi:hypothetical protein K2173_018158 [Erythroxylum novogranatense]|uniref:DUF7054 domain-containing protein n=1 Tax=Erythroxylum novogranatense TaxID=1862640 RepID=A0AAV8TMZ5_9ROSI|nr:hypothetical protein K2173_018158 [Erythroxylum novogranatense]